MKTIRMTCNRHHYVQGQVIQEDAGIADLLILRGFAEEVEPEATEESDAFFLAAETVPREPVASPSQETETQPSAKASAKAKKEASQ